MVGVDERQLAKASTLELRKEAQKLLRESLQQAPPSVLYHYTSASAFVSILTTGELFATDSRYLNDKTELRYSRDVVESAITSAMKGAHDEAAQAIRSSVADLLAGVRLPSVYVTSLSADGDLLSQWRAYCERGRGFAIGLSEERLRRLPRVNIMRVVYDQDEQSKIVIALVQLFRPAVETAVASGNAARVRELQNIVWLPFGVLRSVFKHPAFAEEREYRNFIFDPVNVQYRATVRGVVPYMALPIRSDADKVPIARIVVGPCLDSVLQQSSVTGLLASLGHKDVPIEASRVPFVAE